MKTHGYKLAGADIPEALRGTVIACPLPESYDEAATLTQDGNPNRWLALGNQQFLLNTEREAKAVAESEEIAKLIAEGHVAKAQAAVQAAANAYRDGGGRKAGVPNVTKVKAAAIDTGKQKLAAMTPEARAKALKVLESLGMDAALVA
jgi:hypothetical protein